jgi:hypothetical protein
MDRVKLDGSDYSIYAALRAAFRPFETGSAYGTMRAETYGGATTIVYGLAERSKQRATARDVVHALNAAHRDALCMALRTKNNRDALAAILADVIDAAPATIDTAAVLLCDAWGMDPNDNDSHYGPYSIRYAARHVSEYDDDARAIVETLQAAARLGA